MEDILAQPNLIFASTLVSHKECFKSESICSSNVHKINTEIAILFSKR